MEKFKASVSQQSVSTLVQRIDNEEEKIILNPAYQRNIVWETKHMSYFINSVLHGIVPNNIIFNIDEHGNYVCIDGKQRLTSLQRFKNNEIPVIFDNDDKTVHAYYSKIPDDQEEDINYRLLTQEEKNTFNQMNIHITTYTKLSYEDQINIFHRIQHGKALKPGEIMSAFFSDDKITDFFTKFCGGKQEMLSKYIKGTNRKEYVPHIVAILYMISKNVCQVPDKNNREKFLKSIDRLPKIKTETTKIDKLIDICYGPNLLGNPRISSKLQQNVRFMTIWFIKNEFKDFNKITSLQFEYIRSAIRKTSKDIEGGEHKIIVTKKDIKTLEGIYNLMKRYYNDLKAKNLEVSDEETDDIAKKLIDSDSENEDIAEDENSESSEEKEKEKKRLQKILNNKKIVKQVVKKSTK